MALSAGEGRRRLASEHVDVEPPFVDSHPIARAALRWAEALHQGQHRGDTHAVFADDKLVKTRVLRPVHAGNASRMT